MAIRSTGIRPIERNGLKGFGLTLTIDNTNPRGGETPAMIPVETATETQKRLLVSTDPLNSQVSSVPADAPERPSPSQGARASHSTGATVEAETTTSQAVSATHSTWSPWSVCKGSI